MTAQENQPITISLTKVIKRDGRIVDFNFEKLVDSIFKAAESVGGKDREKAIELATEILTKLENELKDSSVKVEDINSAQVTPLSESGAE